MHTAPQETSHHAEIDRQARLFRNRLRETLAGRGALKGGIAGVWAAGLILLAARLSGCHGQAPQRWLLLMLTAATVALPAAILATRRTPPHRAILAALDAAGSAGGLVMCSGADGAAAWPVAVSRLPGIAWRPSRALGGLAVALLFCASVILLPTRFFSSASPEATRGLESLVGELAERVAQAEAEALLPEPLTAALSNHLEKVAESGDATDPARTLEALDHIAEELTKSAAEQAEALATEHAALQATLSLTEQLAASFETEAQTDAQMAEAAAALEQLLSQAPISPSLAGNLLAAVTGTNTLSAATLQQLADMLREAGLNCEGQLMRLEDLKLVEAPACRGSGSCTNAQACAAALAQLLEGSGPDAEAAAALALICGKPGAGGVSRGRGDAPLTWTDPSSREGAAFKDDSLGTAHLFTDGQAQLQGVSASAPEVPDTPAPVTAGALETATPSKGGAPQAPILPRHRETVTRFFE